MLNLKESENQKIWVSSDLHLCHNPKWEIPIWKMRNYNSADEHTNGLIDNINADINPNDYFLMLGDLCLNTPFEKFDELIGHIKCQNIYLILGNHENPHYKRIYKPLVKQVLGVHYTEESEVFPLRYKNIIYLGHYVEIVLNNQFCVLSHYPLHVWNHMSHNSWQLTGHSHQGCAFSNVNNTSGKILDVSPDGHNNKPWSLSEIKAVMDTKVFIAQDEHHK